MLQVTCAIIEHDEKILICQRSAQMKLPLKWEFPGGKIENGETKEECLCREIKEELGLDIELGRTLTTVEYHYSNISLCLHPFLCKVIDGQVQATEHAQVIWVAKEDLPNYDWAEADIPIVKEYLSL